MNEGCNYIVDEMNIFLLYLYIVVYYYIIFDCICD